MKKWLKLKVADVKGFKEENQENPENPREVLSLNGLHEAKKKGDL